MVRMAHWEAMMMVAVAMPVAGKESLDGVMV